MTHEDGSDSVTGAFPATPAQERFYFLEQATPGFTGNNLAIQWELRGAFSNDSVERAARAVIARHEVLRTRFVEREGRLWQEVLAHVPFRVGFIDVRSLPERERDARVFRISEEMSRATFDLSRPCQMRLTLVRVAPERAVLLIAVHHAIFDGHSIRVLGREFGRLISAFESGGDPGLPDLPLQYGDYARWQEACAQSEARAASARFWRETLADAPYFELPPDRPRAPLSVRRGTRMDLPLDPDFGERLSATARRKGMSIFTLGAAAFVAALHRATGARDISFGTAVSGRDAPELLDLVGVFINPVALRFRPDPAGSLDDLLAQSDRVVRDALAHGDHPFDDVVRALSQRPDPLRTPLVSVFFGLQKVFLEEEDYGAVALRSMLSQTPGVTHDLSVNVTGRASGWTAMIDYDADRFDPATIEKLAAMLRAAFDQVIEAPATTPLAAPGQAMTGETRPELRVVAPEEAETGSDTEARLAEIWAEVLGLPPAACHGDFFDLGGHSLLVLRMLARVEARFGVRPDIARFLAAPTLAGVARSIDALQREEAAREGGDWTLADLSPGLSDAPLVVTVNQPFLYTTLSRRLSDRLRFVALHLAEPEAVSGPDSLDRLAEEAAGRISSRIEGRPALLIGHCVDGLMAWMIAARLRAAGHEQVVLAMTDTWRPGSAADLGRLRLSLRRWGTRLGRWRQYWLMRQRGRLSWTGFLAKNAVFRRLLIRLGRIEPPTEAELREWQVNNRLVSAFEGHLPDGWEGETILFRTAGQPADARTRLFGWRGRLPADTPVFDLPGWHEEAMMSEGTGEVAEILLARLSRHDIAATDAQAPARHSGRA